MPPLAAVESTDVLDDCAMAVTLAHDDKGAAQRG
jgi:hypothetical protein